MYRIARAASYAAEKASISAGTWYFAPIGACLAVALLLAGGVPMNFGHWIEDPVARSVFEASVCVVLAYVFSFVFWFIRGVVFGAPVGGVSFLVQLRRKVHPAIAIAVLAGLVSVAAVCYYFWDVSRGAVLWTWKAESWPIGITRSGDSYGIYNFGFRGTNRSEKPLTNIKTSVRSNITGDVVALFFSQDQAIAPERVVIPPGVTFNLDAVLATQGPMISFDAFKKDYANFTFSFEHDGQPSFERTFTEPEVDRIISEGYKFHQELAKKVNDSFGGPKIRIK